MHLHWGLELCRATTTPLLSEEAARLELQHPASHPQRDPHDIRAGHNAHHLSSFTSDVYPVHMVGSNLVDDLQANRWPTLYKSKPLLTTESTQSFLHYYHELRQLQSAHAHPICPIPPTYKTRIQHSWARAHTHLDELALRRGECKLLPHVLAQCVPLVLAALHKPVNT